MALDEDNEIAQRRSDATNAIVDSESEKKLVVAGPGTGKTFTFRRALESCGGRGLALTFIRSLVADLQSELDDVADVFTFHGFCKYQLHRHPVDDLEKGWHYYPPLLYLFASDLALIAREWSERDLTQALHTLDDSDRQIAEVMRLGDYYNAVSHTDVVYRVLRHFDEHSEELPAFPLIVVDEYQDFSELETTLIQLLSSKSKVLIAGDDDQALYGFKGADPRFIRELAEGAEYERFALPYCSRCTDVVVKSVRDVLSRATANGNLADRLEKEFECYVPEKEADSEVHPVIIHAVCSVQSKKAPYVGRYILKQIAAISAEDIADSAAKRYPTVLVIGPQPFLGGAFETIREMFPDASLRAASQVNVELLDGYQMLARDGSSRLGWRIVIECDSFGGSNAVLAEVTRDETELVDLLPDDYRSFHLALVQTVVRLLEGEDVDPDELARLEAVVELTSDQLFDALNLAEKHDSFDAAALNEDRDDLVGSGGDDSRPSIICTSLTGSKGLSAGHVFIVGFNNGHFPRDPDGITDQEVCQFLVGLSRTRKQCHLVSVRHYGTGWLNESRFAGWIEENLQRITIDKAYLDGA